ncbi:hypothetical protein DRN67_00095 [Candidatus Micrarchaeota archaeon]|nr:MAG: hypothetical protein DRN67_00095 [Candidatus Micrarchaeota archaeon]
MNKAVAALLLVLIIALAYLVFSSRTATTKDEALRFVNEDLNSKYPDAYHEILEAEKEGGNWMIKARVTFDMGSPCPSRLHVDYKYPEFGYVVREDWITQDCQACINLPSDECVILFEEEAVIASHTRLGAQEVSEYILEHSDARPLARFYGDEGYPPDGKAVYTDVWLVTWQSDSDNSTLNVLLSKENGNIINVWGQ